MGERDDGDGQLLTGITRKTLLIMVNFVLMGIIGIISWKCVSNFMPPPIEGVPNEVGIVTFAMGFAGMFSFITNLGFGAAHVKRISEGEDIGVCIGTFLAIQGVLVTIFLATVVGAIFIWKDLLGRGFESTEQVYTIYIILGYFIANNLASVGLQTFVAKIEIAKNQLAILVAAAVQLVVTVIVVISTDSVYLYALTFVVGGAVNLCVSLYYLLHFKIKRPSYRMFKSYLTFALPIFIVSALAILPPHIDKVMIQLFWNSTDVAIYFGGQKFSIYLLQIPAGLGMILFPTFSSLKSRGKGKEIRKLTYYAEKLMTMIMAPICVLFFVLALPIVTLLGSDSYSGSYLVLQPLAIWGFFRSLSSPYRNLIMGVGRPKILAFISFIGVVAIIGFNLIFIPTDIQFLGLNMLGLGPRGAAYATLISALVTFVLFRFFAFRYERVLMNPKILKFILAALIMGCSIYILNDHIPADNYLLFLLYSATAGLIYIAVLIPIRAFSKEDVALFRNVLNPVIMIKYIKEELLNKNRKGQ
ncbi:MAG: oligosaccharide flippase family protein [Thermoplasmata archaeon]|nr:oligosaccharide flippase family protein [Thermoplasmata archaeon]